MKVKITEKDLHAFTKNGFGLKKSVADIVGEKYPLRKGWYNRLLGKEVEQEVIDKAIAKFHEDENKKAELSQSLDGNIELSTNVAHSMINTYPKDIARILVVIKHLEKEVKELSRKFY